MAQTSFSRVRAEVTELWSGDPITDSGLVQRMVEWHSVLQVPYPEVKPIDMLRGVWDIYLPEDAVREFDRRGVTQFEIEAVDRYFSVRFLDKEE